MGLGSPNFDTIVEKIVEIITRFKVAIHPKKLLSVEYTEYEGERAVDLHTCYFTERRYGSHARHIPFSKDIDPVQILEDIQGTLFVHAKENEVEYLQKVTENNRFVR
jgi:hypothetical protein